MTTQTIGSADKKSDSNGTQKKGDVNGRAHDAGEAVTVKVRDGVAVIVFDVPGEKQNTLGDKSAEALAGSSAFPNLRELDLRRNPRITARGKKLLRDKFGDRVKFD
jgi:hypothetical protein